MKYSMNMFYKFSMLLLVLSMAACSKPDVPVGAGESGSTFVKILNSGTSVLAFDAVSTPQSTLLLDVRKDPNSEASTKGSTAVTVSLDQAYLDKYNEDNDTEYEILPMSLFSTSPAISADGKYQFTFGPDELYKQVQFTLPDATKLDFSKQYALPLTITNVDATGKIASSKTAMVIVLVKNTWDGEYEVTGTMEDLASSTLGGLFPMKYHLITSGANTVDGFDPVHWEDYFIPIASGSDVSGYGAYSPVFEFDPVTNKVVKVTNIYGQPAGNGRSASLDPSGENYYDPATKTIKVKFFMHQPSSIPTAPHIRVKFDWTLKRTGDR